MSALDPADRERVERVRLTLADVDADYHEAASRDELDVAVCRLRAALVTLLRVVEDFPGVTRSERLAAQRDAQFRSLARAARSEIGAARGALSRLDAFEAALSKMLRPDETGPRS